MDRFIDYDEFGRYVSFSNLKSNTRLSVYSMDGSLFFNRQLNSDASIAISKGLWIVKANSSEGSKVVKVLVK